MPVIKSAKKKLRQDKKRTLRNAKVEERLKDAIKAAKKNPTIKTVSLAFQLADKAAKNHIIHKNKAARIKSSLTKEKGSKTEKNTTEAKVTKKVTPAKKPSSKKSTKK